MTAALYVYVAGALAVIVLVFSLRGASDDKFPLTAGPLARLLVVAALWPVLLVFTGFFAGVMYLFDRGGLNT